MKIELDFYTCRRPELMTQKALETVADHLAATGATESVVKGEGHVLTIEWTGTDDSRWCEQYEWEGATPRWNCSRFFQPNEAALD